MTLPPGWCLDTRQAVFSDLPGSSLWENEGLAMSATNGSLAAEDVHVWCVPLSVPEELKRRLTEILSPDERERANRYAHRAAREQFATARAFVRLVLARYLGTHPRRIRFEQTNTGKPMLPGRPLHFNVSHSHELGLIAVTRRGEVGIDIERVRTMPTFLDMAGRYFTPCESSAIRDLPRTVSEEAFFHVWTRKEAFLKAIGLGLSHGLERFAVSVPPDNPARILHIDGDRCAGKRWHLRGLVPSPGYVAALAIESADVQVTQQQWQDEHLVW